MQLHSRILGEGQPLIILHGFLGMGDNWKTLGKKYAKNNFQVHLVDQRNHGRSLHNNSFDYELMVADLKQYCEVHELSDVIILGHSMGGKTAMLYATSYPEMVSKLIVADISPRFYPIHHDAILEGLSQLDFDIITTRKEAEKSLEAYVPEFGIRQFLLKNVYWKEKGQLELRINLEVLRENVSEVGEALPLQAKYDGDTLFLKGDRSEYIGDEDESIIKNHFKKASVVTIKNAGHWLHAENPDDFYEEVLQFLVND